jgi:hypothetical protein
LERDARGVRADNFEIRRRAGLLLRRRRRKGDGFRLAPAKGLDLESDGLVGRRPGNYRGFGASPRIRLLARSRASCRLRCRSAFDTLGTGIDGVRDGAAGVGVVEDLPEGSAEYIPSRIRLLAEPV